MRKLRGPSPAMIVACLALAVALSGASYAAVTIPRNSVGTKQLKANAVTGAKVAANTLGGADINESSLQGFMRPGNAAGGSLAGTFPNPTLAQNSVDTFAVAPDSLTTADIDEATLDVVHGTGQVQSASFFLAANTLAFEDVVDVPGFGFLQATCNAGATAASIRYRNPSAQNVRVWADDGGSDPKNLSADSGTSSANTVDSTAFDLVTLYLGSDTLTYRTVVHLAIANTGTTCRFFANIDRIS